MFKEEGCRDGALRRERVTEHDIERKQDTQMEEGHQPGSGDHWDDPVDKDTFHASQAVRVQSPGPTLSRREPTPELFSDLQHP